MPMMRESRVQAKDITYIALGIGALISGGIVIYQISAFLPIPGLKYILMAPYLSIVMYILLAKIGKPYTLLMVGLVFALVMVTVNVFMSIAILITTLLTQFSMFFMGSVKNFGGAALFSANTGLCALVVSKYMIGGIFADIPTIWMGYTGLICLVFGVFGAMMGQKIMKHINVHTYR